MTDQTKEPTGLPVIETHSEIELAAQRLVEALGHMTGHVSLEIAEAYARLKRALIAAHYPSDASLAAPAPQPDEADQRYEAAMDFMESLAESQQPQQGEEGKLRDGGGRSNEE